MNHCQMEGVFRNFQYGVGIAYPIQDSVTGSVCSHCVIHAQGRGITTAKAKSNPALRVTVPTEVKG